MGLAYLPFPEHVTFSGLLWSRCLCYSGGPIPSTSAAAQQDALCPLPKVERHVQECLVLGLKLMRTHDFMSEMNGHWGLHGELGTYFSHTIRNLSTQVLLKTQILKYNTMTDACSVMKPKLERKIFSFLYLHIVFWVGDTAIYLPSLLHFY